MKELYFLTLLKIVGYKNQTTQLIEEKNFTNILLNVYTFYFIFTNLSVNFKMLLKYVLDMIETNISHINGCLQQIK